MIFGNEIRGVLSPGESTALAAVTAIGDGWDSAATAEIDIPAGAAFLHVYLDQAAFLVADASTDDPAENGCTYAASKVHVIPCRKCLYLHYKNAAAGVNVTVSATAFGG